MKSLNEFIVLAERTMTKKEKSKEDRLKDKYDDSDMKNNMKDQYGEEEGEKVYYATIRKQAMKKEEVEEGVIDAVKKGAKRHAKAVQAKKIKDRKAVPYAALAAEHQPEGEVVSELKTGTLLSYSQKATNQLAFKGDGGKKAQKRATGIKKAAGKMAIRATDPDGSLGFNKNVRNEDYMSGQTGKIQKRTLAWMRKKGMKGAPGLDAMKAREAEHKAKRGVKGVKEEAGCETKKIENKGKKKIDPNKNPVVEAKVDQGRSDYGKATIRNWRHSGPSTVEPAMFDPENKRGKTIDKRRAEHKARRGVKGAKVPTYKKESFSDWRTDLGEEGYDRWRDDRLVKYGIGHDGSDRKGSSSYSPRSKQKGDTAYQKEMKKKHGGKLPSAIDVVKARIEKEHGKGAVMDTKKSKG